MKVEPINELELNKFILSQPLASGCFLQSADWGRLMLEENHQVERLGFYDNENLVAVVQIIFNQLPLGKKWAYVPKGPVSKNNFELQVIRELVEYLKKLSVVYLKIEPPINKGELNLIGSGFKKVKELQTFQTSILDLNKEVENLLAGMHQKTRYNIRLSEKKNLTWRWDQTVAFEDFWEILKKTSHKDGFKLHSKNHYKKMIDLFGVQNLTANNLAVRLASVSADGQILGAIMTIWFGDTVTYLHGGLLNIQRELMANYYLHWQTILKAKELGYKRYDWWGVALAGEIHNPSWRGFSRFKLGFGGAVSTYLGAYDYVYQPSWYLIFKLIRLVKKALFL